MFLRRFVFLFLLLFIGCFVAAQEQLRQLPFPHEAFGLYGSERMSKTNPARPLELPFFDDFSNYVGLPSDRMWQPSGAYVSVGFAFLPPTIGMLTLDALDANGCLYSSLSGRFSGDTVASQKIRLDSVWNPNRRHLGIGDSVMFSFYYLPGGGEGNMWERIGECPDLEDSLILEFWNPRLRKWDMVWARGGISIDTLVAHTHLRWQYVCLPIVNEVYFDSTFQFRFRNYCSLTQMAEPGFAGNTDQWHIDYVTIDRNRTSGTPNFRDIAFVAPAPTFLRDFTAMPASQFDSGNMAESVSMTISNLYAQTLPSHYTYRVFDAYGSEVGSYDGGYENVPSFLPNGVYQTYVPHANPPVNFVYPVGGNTSVFKVEHVIKEGGSSDVHTCNDTVVFEQVFDNYFAYDDGTPENGYGVTSSQSGISIACKFKLNVADTLTAVDLYFNRTRDGENEQIPFYITVWENNNGVPGRVIYTDNQARVPRFNGINRYARYVLESPLLVEGTVFVGFEQASKNYINLGFDRNNNVQPYIFYNIGGGWQNTVYSGALMLRPCLGSRATIGVNTLEELPANIVVYPNPASDIVRLAGSLPVSGSVVVYTMQGQRVLSCPIADTIDVSKLRRGTYILKIESAENAAIYARCAQKIVIVK